MNVLNNLKIKDIKNILYNRYPFLLIDGAYEVVPGKSSKAYKRLTANEWFFPVHFPEQPMMPGMIQMEALIQTISLAILSENINDKKVLRVIKADKIKLKKRVVPGDFLQIESHIEFLDETMIEGMAKGYVDDKEVCSGKFVFVLDDIKE